MKKKLLAFLLVVACLATYLTGCSDNGSDSTDTSNSSSSGGTSSSEQVELVVWESTDGPDEFIRQAGEKFTEQNPNVTIKYVNVELGDTTTQIALDGPAGVGPDLFVAPHDKLGELVGGGHVLPTENADDVKARVIDTSATALTNDGTMYGYPVSSETYALFYNKDLIPEEDVPTTFEDLKTYISDFNESGKYAFLMDVGNVYYSIIFTAAEDNLLFGDDGTDTTNSNINSERSISGMEFFQSLRSVIDIPAADLTTAQCDGAFSSGTTAMYITGLWNVVTFEEAGINFGVTTMPSMPDESTPAMTFSGTRAMFVSAYSDHPDEANAFAEFLISDEMQKLRYELTGALPSVSIDVDSEYAPAFIEQLEYSFPMPSISDMTKYWDSMNAASANIWDGADVATELNAAESAIVG